MSLDMYLFEKACYVPEALAGLADDLRTLQAGSLAQRKLGAHLNVALRHALASVCALVDRTVDSQWIVELSREGYTAWKRGVKPALEDAMFGPDNRDDAIKRSGLPRTHGPESAPREVDVDVLGSQTMIAIAALLDLSDVIREYRGSFAEDVKPAGHLGQAFNGATKVLATLIDIDWDLEWPNALRDRGWAAWSAVEAKLRESDDAWRFSWDVQPLEEAWLAESDLHRTPEVEQEAERQRRAAVTNKNKLPYDLVVPPRQKHSRLEGLLGDRLAEHRVCFDYAVSPDGGLVLDGVLASGMYEIMWAIGRHWFVDRLRSVEAITWQDVVEDNLMAQNRALWDCPYLLVSMMMPVRLLDGTYADPCYAERMLEHRLVRRLPTVLTVEICGIGGLNLRHRTVELLRKSTHVKLPALDEQDRAVGKMFER